MAPTRGKKSEETSPATNDVKTKGNPPPPTSEAATFAFDRRFGALQAVGQHSSDLLVVIDLEGRVTYANPAALETFGISLEQGVGTSSFTYLHPDDLERVTNQLITLAHEPGATRRDVVRTVTESGEVRELEIVSTNCLDNDEVAGIVLNGRDVTERLDYVARLETREHWFRTLVANSSDMIAVLDDQARLIYANPATVSELGFNPDTHAGRNVLELIHPDDHDAIAAAFFERVHDDGTPAPSDPGEPGVFRFRSSSGAWHFLEAVLTNCLDDPAIGGVVVNARDVTERINLSRALQTLTQGNQVLVRASEEPALLNDLCQTIVSSGTYLLAWVGTIDDDNARSIRPIASAGTTEYLDEVRFSWGDNEFGRGPTGMAVRTGQVQVLRDIRLSQECLPWQGPAETYGLRTGCVFPLTADDNLIGTLTIYAGEPGAFGATEVTLLGELADDLAYGIGRLRDAQRLAANEALLRETEQRFRLAFEDNMAPMSFTDLNDRLVAVNDAFCEMVGFEREELIGFDSKPFTYYEDVGITEESLRRAMTGRDDQMRYVKRYQRKDGRIIVVEVSRSPARDAEGRTIYFVFSERDVTEERALTAQLSHQALHDPLTGLANRALFDDRLLQAHARVTRQGGVGAVLLLDLDDFKGVNDTHGHLVGDQLLVAIANRLERTMRRSDTLSRFGGDEFLYLAEGLSSPADAERVAAQLLEALAIPFSLAGVHLEQHASVGVFVWDAESRDSREFIQNADVALHEAKRQGKGHFKVFTPGMHQRAVNHFELVQELRRALSNGELSMHYQPIVDLTSGDVLGFEALMRWHHPERGWVAPTVFIPLAEQSELILELGAFAVLEAVTEASTWPPEVGHAGAPYVTVNLSAHQFQNPGLVSTIAEALSRSGLAPERLILEITESVALLDVTQTLGVMERLNALGIGFALDDFGTGFSSLSHLVLLRPKVIKIDQSFVRPSHESVHNDTLLEMIISLGQRLGMTVLAEGIETQAQLTRLAGYHCELGQGYLFSPAVPAYSVTTVFERAQESWGIEGWQRQPRLTLPD